jgi:hypothetical protein
MVGNPIKILIPCPATTALGIQDIAYHVVEASLFHRSWIGQANPSKPSPWIPAPTTEMRAASSAKPIMRFLLLEGLLPAEHLI